MSDESPDQPPKLIIDDDWKSEAKREKEKLSAKAAETADQKSADADRPVQFGDLVRMFASQAAMYLGLIPDPQTQQRMLAPEVAAINIDMLAVLEDKTKNNLSDDEAKELTQTLAELRSIFVETTQAVQQAIAEGKINPDGSPGPNAPAGGAGGGMGPPGSPLGPPPGTMG